MPPIDLKSFFPFFFVMYEASIKVVYELLVSVEEFLSYSVSFKEDRDFGSLDGRTRNGQIVHVKILLQNTLDLLREASSPHGVVNLYVVREAKRLDPLILVHQNDLESFTSNFLLLNSELANYKRAILYERKIRLETDNEVDERKRQMQQLALLGYVQDVVDAKKGLIMGLLDLTLAEFFCFEKDFSLPVKV